MSFPFSWPEIDPKTANHTRYVIHKRIGHYENFFLRANHPEKSLAFWIRYTIFSPENKKTAIGEVIAAYFDGETGNHSCVKTEIPIENCVFYSNELNMTMGESRLSENHFNGRAVTSDQLISWDMNYFSDEAPLFLIQRNMYDMPFPKAKSLVAKPLAVFSGSMTINKASQHIENWVGSQNHNWGIKHTDHYAWGQVAGFDNAPNTFFEISTARFKYGPLWTPFMTIMVLRHEGKEYRLNTIPQSFRAKGNFHYFDWQFSSETPTEKIEGAIAAEVDNFIGINYYNSSGGVKLGLITKIARCNIALSFPNEPDRPEINLSTRHRAGFEILTTDQDHGVPISV